MKALNGKFPANLSEINKFWRTTFQERFKPGNYYKSTVMSDEH